MPTKGKKPVIKAPGKTIPGENTLRQLHDDPAYFVTHVLNQKPTDQQFDFYKTIRESKSPFIARRAGKGIGKTWDEAALGYWWLCTRLESLVVYTSPKLDQLKEQVWTYWRRLQAGAKEPWSTDFVIESTVAYRKDSPHGARALARVAPKERVEMQQGWHHPHMLIIVAEASGVEDAFIQELQSTCTEKDNRILLDANPTRRTGAFHRAFHEERKLYTLLHYSSLDSPLITEAWHERMKMFGGTNSNHYRVYVLGEFPTADRDSLISLEMAEAALARYVAPTNMPVLVGVDPGGSADGDATGVVIRQGSKLLGAKQFWIHLEHQEELVGEILQFVKQVTLSNIETYAVDVIGLGVGVYSLLKAQGYPVTAVNVADGVDHSRVMSGEPNPNRLRDKLWLDLREWLPTASIDTGDETTNSVLVSEITAPRWDTNTSGFFQVESKDKLRARHINSPNLADALCCTFVYRPPSGFSAQFAERHDRVHDEMRGFYA